MEACAFISSTKPKVAFVMSRAKMIQKSSHEPRTAERRPAISIIAGMVPTNCIANIFQRAAGGRGVEGINARAPRRARAQGIRVWAAGPKHTLFLLGDLVAAILLQVHRGLRRGEAVAGARISLADHVALDRIVDWRVG